MHTSNRLPVTSTKNPLLKEVRRAVERGSLTSDGLAVAEGFHLLEEALRSRSSIASVLVSETASDAVSALLPDVSAIPLIQVSDSALSSVSATETMQGVITLVAPPEWIPEDLFRGTPLVVILDRIQDPGNAGAILRVAEAFGATGVLALRGTVNLWNPKAIRASAGSVFRVPVLSGVEESSVATLLQDRQMAMFAAMPDARQALCHADLTAACALIIGSEGSGVSTSLAVAATHLTIPTSRVESLNAAVAAGVVLYEASRQRRPQ